MSTEVRCKICGNPDISEQLSADNPNKRVCDWTCASILNKKLIIISSVVGVLGTIGSFIVQPLFLIFFIPFSTFSFYSLFLIITGQKQKQQDRLEYVGEEEDELNKYLR